MSLDPEKFPDGAYLGDRASLDSLIETFIRVLDVFSGVLGREVCHRAWAKSLEAVKHRDEQARLEAMYPDWPKASHKCPVVIGKEEPDD